MNINLNRIKKSKITGWIGPEGYYCPKCAKNHNEEMVPIYFDKEQDDYLFCSDCGDVINTKIKGLIISH